MTNINSLEQKIRPLPEDEIEGRIIDVNEKDVKSAYVIAPFDVAKTELESKGYSVITPEQFAKLRIAKGPEHNVSLKGAFTSMGNVMIPQKGRYITPISFVMQNPTKATEAHRQGKEFYISNEDAEKALSLGVKIPYNQFEVPFNRLGEDEVTAFIFGKTAKAYGSFLQEALNESKEETMFLVFSNEKYINSQKSPFANQLWFYRLDCYGITRSDIYGHGLDLYYGDVRGVQYQATN
jgi:hypothetical protein